MRSQLLLLLFVAACPLIQGAKLRILLSNDDGWAENSVRELYDTLSPIGDIALVAPGRDRSNDGLSRDPARVTKYGDCQYETCAVGSPPTGQFVYDRNATYVNAGPIIAVKHGIEFAGPNSKNWNGQKPELVVVGPDVGKRAMGTKQVRDSPTVAAAAYAAREAKIPAIAFSNTRGPPSDYRDLYWKNSNRVNDGLAMDIIEALTSSKHDPKPFLPDNTFLNVNFPPWDVRDCHSRKQIKLILTRVNTSKGFDVHQCGSFHLPTEEDVKKVKSIQHCYATVSLVNAKDMTSDNVEGQKLIRDKLGKLLECV